MFPIVFNPSNDILGLIKQQLIDELGRFNVIFTSIGIHIV